jgi:hypothetical protein
MKREAINKILNFLKENEGMEIPEAYLDLISYEDMVNKRNADEEEEIKKEKADLIRMLENHPDDSQFRYDGNIDVSGTGIRKLPNDLYVGGYLNLEDCFRIRKLPNDLYVGDALLISNTNITNLPGKLYVGGNLFIRDSPFADNYTNEEVYGNIARNGDKMTCVIYR